MEFVNAARLKSQTEKGSEQRQKLCIVPLSHCLDVWMITHWCKGHIPFLCHLFLHVPAAIQTITTENTSFFYNNFIHRKSNSSYSNSRLLEWLFLVWHEKWIGNAKRHTSLVSKTSSLIQDMKRSSPWGVLIPLEFNKK